MKGFVLPMCLLLSILFLVMVLGMLGSRGPQQEAAANLRLHQQARHLAQAGLEDFRVKLGKDIKFPPPPSPDEPFFSYSEGVYDVDDSLVGVYQVKVDQSLNQGPYFVFRVTSVGILGQPSTPLAQVRLHQEIDTCPFDRSNPLITNPRRHQVLSQEELP